jgi:hypothetical protein
MPGDSVIIEALKRPETWAIMVAIMGLVGSFRVINLLLSIVKHRETSNEKLLTQLENIAECQAKVIATAGLTYSALLEHRDECRRHYPVRLGP